MAWLGWIVLGCILSFSVSFGVLAKEGVQLRYFNQLEQAGLLMVDAQQVPLHSKNVQRAFIPASTTKLITALLALQHWGADYRFKTEFYLTESNTKSSNISPPLLLVKGYGDPFLVSEELKRMAKILATRLKQQNITTLAGVLLDVSYYERGVKFSGASQTNNPYDAVSSALAANFNTVHLQKSAEGIVSAEQQTPLTATALWAAQTHSVFKANTRMGKKHRINLGQDERVAQRYFAELLMAFLSEEGIEVHSKENLKIEWSSLNKSLASILFYTHKNQRTLAEMVRPMMKYSTNFVANQLALNLSRECLDKAASAQTVANLYQQRLTQLFGWKNFTLEEGAGLSRHNRLSPQQLIDVLNAFKPWRHLLPEIEKNVYAKSGTLLGVSTLAGYVHKGDQWHPFAFMINEKVPRRYRNQLAKELADP